MMMMMMMMMMFPAILVALLSLLDCVAGIRMQKDSNETHHESGFPDKLTEKEAKVVLKISNMYPDL